MLTSWFAADTKFRLEGRDFWKLAKDVPNEIDLKFFREVLAFGYSPWGRTPLVHLKSQSIFKDDTIYDFFRAISNPCETSPEKVFDALKAPMKERLQDTDEKFLLLLSGGPDSIWLATQLAKSNANVECLNMKGLGVDEVEIAEDVAGELGLVLHKMEITDEQCSEDFLDIVDSLAIPVDMGSSIFSYYAAKFANERTTVSGEFGDTIFAPSVSAHFNVLDGGAISPYWSTIYEWNSVFGPDEVRPSSRNPFSQNLINELLYGLLTEYPNYYALKCNTTALKFGTKAWMPYGNPKALALSLGMPGLHVRSPYKQYLVEAIAKESPAVGGVVSKKKVPLKALVPQAVIETWYNNTIEDRLQIDPASIPRSDRVKYILAMWNTWFEAYERKVKK